MKKIKSNIQNQSICLVKFKFFLIVFTFLLFSNNLKSQNITVYENKCFEITAKYLEAINVNKIVLKNKKAKDYGQILVNYMQMQGIEPRLSLVALLSYEKEINDAKKFMTKIEIEKEKEEIQLIEKKKQEEIEIRKYKYSDLSHLKSNVETELKKWLLQGEFEKNENYKIRLVKEGEQQLNFINFNEFQKYISSFQISVSFETYIPDEEVFPIKCKIENRSIFQREFIWEDKIKIPIEEAKLFKESLRSSQNKIYIGTENCRNWGFCDYNLIPKSIIIKYNDKYFESYLPLKNFKNYVVSFSSFGFNQPELKSFEFNLFGYQTWKQKFK